MSLIQSFSILPPGTGPVTFADGALQSLSANDREPSPRVLNQTRILQMSRRDRYRLATSSQHIGHELLRHHKLIGVRAVVN